jgi:hypothetical protein
MQIIKTEQAGSVGNVSDSYWVAVRFEYRQERVYLQCFRVPPNKHQMASASFHIPSSSLLIVVLSFDTVLPELPSALLS